MSLNSQFTVVFNDIICFPVRFFGNSNVSVKNAFSSLPVFSSDRKMLMSL